MAQITSVLLGEPIIHGYDVAKAVGAPWPMNPEYSALFLGVFQRLGYSMIFRPGIADHEATYRVDIGGTESSFVRVTEQTCEEIPAASSVDCIISADPLTAHLVVSGRMSRWPAIALGRLRFSGERPEIGPGFFDLFLFP